MKSQLSILALASGLLLSACNSGSSTTTNTNGGGIIIGGYTMSVTGISTSTSSGCSFPSGFLPTSIVCDRNSSNLVVSLTFQGTPNFYVSIPETQVGLNITNTPYDFSDESTTVSGNCTQTASSSFSCTTTLIASGVESGTVNLSLTGQAGDYVVYNVTYQ